MTIAQNLLYWFTQHPLSTVTMVFITGILGVLVYSFFEPQEQG